MSLAVSYFLSFVMVGLQQGASPNHSSLLSPAESAFISYDPKKKVNSNIHNGKPYTCKNGHKFRSK